MQKEETKTLYKPFKSKLSGKKYSVYVMRNNKKVLIHFGDSNMQHFKDKLGVWSKLDHNDKQRRKNFLTRTAGITNKQGEKTANNKNYANYWARRILW
jgi:hypothetical protein